MSDQLEIWLAIGLGGSVIFDQSLNQRINQLLYVLLPRVFDTTQPR